MGIVDVLKIADLIQILILIVLIVTAYFALKGINETKNIHKETLLWNKKNKTIDILNEFRKITPSLTRERFAKFNIPGSPIPLEEIKKAIEEDRRIKSEIGKYLNHHEGIAIGIKQNLYEEEVVKLARKTSFCQTYSEFEEYINEVRKVSNPKTWINFENLTKKWKENEVQQSI